MKKFFLCAIFLCGTEFLSALPIGNPSDPALFEYGLFWDDYCYECYNVCYDPYGPCGFDWGNYSLRGGYYGDFVFNRKLEIDDSFDADIEHFSIYTNSGILALNCWERIDIYGIFGATKCYLNSSTDAFAISGTGRIELETDSEFSWSVAIKAVLFECDCTTIGFMAQYFSVHPNVRRVTFDDSISFYPDDTLELRYNEWQFGLGISQRIGLLIPYVGIKWSKVDINFEGSAISPLADSVIFPDLKNDLSWGYVVGVSLLDNKMMNLNIETRFIDEKALAVNAQWRF